MNGKIPPRSLCGPSIEWVFVQHCCVDRRYQGTAQLDVTKAAGDKQERCDCGGDIYPMMCVLRFRTERTHLVPVRSLLYPA